MAYTSFFSGGGSTTKAQPNNSGNGTGAGGKGGYKSFFGTRVQSAPTDDQLKIDRAQKAQQDAITRQQQQKQQQAQAQQQKSSSLLGKVVRGAKTIANAATTSEQAITKPIARLLPGGQNDLKAENEQIQSNINDRQQATKLLQSSNQKQQNLGKTLLQANKQNTADTAQNVNETAKEIKTDTKRGRIAAGALGTAADILTAGTYGAAAKGAKAAEVANEATKASKVARAVNYTKEVAPIAAGNATAGGLNAAAGGGDKKEIEKNALIGFAVPEALHVGSVTAANAAAHLGMHPRVATLLDKTGVNQARAAVGKDQAVNDLVTNSKAQSLLSTPKPKEPAMAASTAPVASITHPVTEAFDKVYKGGAQGADEAKAASYIRDNPEKALTDYDSRVKDKFGATNVVSGDESKYVIPGFDSTKSASYHEPASALAKVKYQQLLSDTTTKNKPVLLMAGGSGAGKTSALKRLGLNYDNYAAVIDTNTNKLASAQGRIDQALQSGRHVEVFYVHRDPLKAMSHGVIPRGGKEGRIVPIDTHIDTHFGAHETVHQLANHYKDNPQVEFTVASNNHGHGKARQIELDQVPKMSYNREEIKQHLQKAVNDAHQEGKITPQEHALYHGQSNPVGEAGHDVQAVDTAGSRAPSNQPKPQRTTGSERGADQKVAVASAPDTATIKEQITNIKNNEQNYDKFGNLTPEAGKQINGLNKQLNAAGERVAKVDKPVTVTPIEPPARVATPEIKTSKLARGVEANAIRKGLTDGFEGKAEYAGVNISQQAKAAADLLKQDPEQALKIAMGEAHPPEGLLPESVFIALEKQATKAGDTDLIRRLATESRLTSEASGMGQRIRMLGERDGNSAVTAIKEVQKARKAAAEQRANKPLSKAVSNEIKQIRAAKPKVTKETWSSFVDSLKC